MNNNDYKLGFFIVNASLKRYLNVIFKSSKSALKNILFLKILSKKEGSLRKKSVEIDKAKNIKLEESATNTSVSLPEVRSEGRPIVFLHNSDSFYLKYSLAQAASSNPNSKIYLLGDEKNSHYDFVDHHNMQNYKIGAELFADKYIHRSTNSKNFELFCFQRWFILSEFLKKNNIEECFHLDSDVMLYGDITKISEIYKFCDFTLAKSLSGHSMFINKSKSIDMLTQFIMEVYSGKKPYEYDKILSHYYTIIKNGKLGGACDMTLLSRFYRQHEGLIGDTSIIYDGSLFDQHINTSQPGFEMESGIKKLIYKDGFYYGKHINTGDLVKFNSLHFQGRAKKLMENYLSSDAKSFIKV
ncbi:hypothetical protein DYD21_19605 [Rhodohalobacter sp. SW132]|uniref:hypothetical protein n=1 Tax=Rhodohalobacter sp. SW132 TaxID=2293433 RepID=UPI000E234A85|nr:hypothetical protein [Rhodohalobacter sp. SW132]REL24188.1 hypothetical protein DYD21_19605 [Rhodohalobacter sp. SW132]